jgi:hypothetical protein
MNEQYQLSEELGLNLTIDPHYQIAQIPNASSEHLLPSLRNVLMIIHVLIKRNFICALRAGFDTKNP